MLIRMFLSLLIFFIIGYYFSFYNYKKNQFVFYNNLDLQIKRPFRLLCYNVQRLPFLFRPNVDIHSWMERYDIICLQENFCSLTGSSKQSFGYNCIIPHSSYHYLVDSGLSIYSKIPLEYISFHPFKDITDIDRVSNKGFVIAKIEDFYIVNTHLQSCYSRHDEEKYKCITEKEFEQICNQCSQFQKVIIVGDFNIDIKNSHPLMIRHGYKCMCPPKPTYWNNNNKNIRFFFYDGVFYKNTSIYNIQTEVDDPLTDHLGVSFFIR